MTKNSYSSNNKNPFIQDRKSDSNSGKWQHDRADEQDKKGLTEEASALFEYMNDKLGKYKQLSKELREELKEEVSKAIFEKNSNGYIPAIDYVPEMRPTQLGFFLNYCKAFLKKENLDAGVIESFESSVGKILENKGHFRVFDPISLSLVLNAFAKMDFKKDGLNINLKNLGNTINKNLCKADIKNLRKSRFSRFSQYI